MKSRKLKVLIVTMIVGTFIWYMANESIFTDWLDMARWLVGIYVVGNVGEHGAKAIKK